MATNRGSTGIASAAPQARAYVVTPDDSVELSPPANGLYVATDGVLRIQSVGGPLLSSIDVVAGQIIPVKTKLVHTDTTAVVWALDNETS